MSARMQMGEVCSTYKEGHRERGLDANLNGPGNMAKFTVEWLSQSFYSTEGEDKRDAQRSGDSEEQTSQFTPTSPNNSCGYTSASECSDVEEDSEGEAGRRARTKFSSEQIRRLESAFSKHRYLGASQRRKISERLNLSETQVKTWFQNRRMKLKREVQDMRTEFLAVPAALMPPAMLQHHAYSGQLPGVNRSAYPLQETHGQTAQPVMPRYHNHHPYHQYQAFPSLSTHQVIPGFY